MNTRYYFLIVLWAMSLFAPLHAQTYDKMWKEVEQLQRKTFLSLWCPHR